MEKLSSLQKKGQLNAMAPAIIALVVAAVFLILGLIIIQSMRDTDIVAKANSVSFTNESIAAAVTEAGSGLICQARPGSNCAVDSAHLNSTGITSGNYTVTADTCTIAFTGADTQYNNTVWNVTYGCTYGDTAYTGGNLTIVGLGTFADFWEIIVLALVITIVMGLLLVVFGGPRNR